MTTFGSEFGSPDIEDFLRAGNFRVAILDGVNYVCNTYGVTVNQLPIITPSAYTEIGRQTRGHPFLAQMGTIALLEDALGKENKPTYIDASDVSRFPLSLEKIRDIQDRMFSPQPQYAPRSQGCLSP